MKSFNHYYTTHDDLKAYLVSQNIQDNRQLLIQVFTSLDDRAEILAMRDSIVSLLPSATLIGATTDGEICSGKVTTMTTVVSMTQFEDTTLKAALVENCAESYENGKILAETLITAETKVLISFSDGLHCNGEAFLEGVSSVSEDVVVAGGLAGDNARFIQTHTFTKDAISSTGSVGVALNNRALYIHTDYSFNWLSIGNKMRVTKAEGNRLYTVNDLSAVDIYQKYLGRDVAANLPAVGIEFPLIIHKEKGMIARAAVLSHEDGSLSFAGNFSTGDEVTFGYGDAEMVLNYSIEAQYAMSERPVESIFIYSCMARRRFMPTLIENEIAPFQQLAEVSGFFTYGEFFSCEEGKALMNQTMTILGMSESSELPKHIELKPATNADLNSYQKSIKALSHLLNVTTKDMDEKHSALKETTELIRAKKESLKQAQEIGHFGSWEIDLVTKKSIWSDESYRIYRVDPEKVEPTLDTFMSRIIEADREKAAEALASLEDGGQKTCELRVKRDDGVEITVLLNAKMIFDKNGQPAKLIGTTLDITEQVDLIQKNRELATIIEKSSTEIYMVNRDTYQFVYVNEEATKKLGYTQEEMLRKDVFDINEKLEQVHVEELKEQLFQKEMVFNRATRVTKDGHKYPVQSYIQLGKYNNRDVIIIISIDITELVTSELKQKRQEKILEQIHDSVVSIDLNGKITHWNHGATEIHGYLPEECIGHSIEMLLPEKEHGQFKWIMQQTLLHGEFHDQVQKLTKSGKVIYADISLTLLSNDVKEPIGFTCYTQDITQKKEIEAQLQEQTKQLNFQAYHDILTELPNRSLFDDRLEQAIVSAQRHGEKFALLFLDLDNFKQINDTLGHHFGDEVLRQVSHRLKSSLRDADSLARLGGDEFTIIVPGLQSSSSAAKVAQNILDVMKPVFEINDHALHISVSIGISLFPKDSTLKHDLLKYADTAMYRAKDEGRDNYQFYASDMTILAFEKAVLERSLRVALEQDQFKIYYQPQIDARNNTLVGMEALVRWEHPEMGFVMPDKFIPLAEETGIIKELDRFVMRQAMQDISGWYKAGLNPGVLSLNLSMKQLMSSDFIAVLKEMRTAYDFVDKKLELEITESQMMHDPMRSIEILQTLHEMDIEIAIDDFGTGYSSLAYLKRLPVDTLKIDRSFIMDLPGDEEDSAISKAVIALAQSLNLTIIAEGVENSAQIEFLLENGCHYIQGFYYSKALNREDMEIFIKNNKIIERS